MFDRNPIKQTPAGTSYSYLQDHELAEINQLDGIRGNIDKAFTDCFDLSLDKTAASDIRDGLDTSFKAMGNRIKDIEAIADRRLEEEQDREEARKDHHE